MTYQKKMHLGKQISLIIEVNQNYLENRDFLNYQDPDAVIKKYDIF